MIDMTFVRSTSQFTLYHLNVSSRYCLMLYAKSPSAYRLAKNILILPSERTLRNAKVKMLNNCKVGTQDGVISRIRRALEMAQCHHEKLAVLCIDEMTTKGQLLYC